MVVFMADFRYSLLCCFALLLSLTSCETDVSDCQPFPDADISRADEFQESDQFLFRFPLDNLSQAAINGSAQFQNSHRRSVDETRYHSAEDYHLPSGTPVYAIADGKVGYSGRMGGYGWLVIVNHPALDIYSLYGHLSPSRWNIKKGSMVTRGSLLGYLGDSDENGGSKENPLVPHLHFGIRVGQKLDYPGGGQWRWMAGWINICPTDAGWLQPSGVINGQFIPEDGFAKPEAGVFQQRAWEIILSVCYLASFSMILFVSVRRRKWIPLIAFGIPMVLASVYLYLKHVLLAVVIGSLGVILLISAAIVFYRNRRKTND